MSTPRFLYHASAVGLAGEITRPIQQIIDGQATSALPRYGGRALASAPRYQLANLVAHGGATSLVSGAFEDPSGTHETHVQASVTGLDLQGVVIADLLASSVHSSHPVSAYGEPAISIAGAEIRGLRIAGRAIELESWLDLLIQLDTMTKLRDYYKNNADFRSAFNAAAYVGQGDALPADVRRFFPWRNFQPSDRLPEHNGMTILPVFTVKNPSETGFEVFGNVIKVANFGKVQIGELIVESKRRRLMMLHAAMGSPCDGSVSAACSDGNGTTGDPPPPGGNP